MVERAKNLAASKKRAMIKAMNYSRRLEKLLSKDGVNLTSDQHNLFKEIMGKNQPALKEGKFFPLPSNKILRSLPINIDLEDVWVTSTQIVILVSYSPLKPTLERLLTSKEGLCWAQKKGVIIIMIIMVKIFRVASQTSDTPLYTMNFVICFECFNRYFLIQCSCFVQN